MSFSNFSEWRIVDKDGNELEITDVFPLDKPLTIDVTEYDPNSSALAVFKRAAEAEAAA